MKSVSSGRHGHVSFVQMPVRTSKRSQLVDITADVERAIHSSGVQSGVCYLVVPHTTAGILVNENDDPAVARDIEKALDRLVPRDQGYEHLEGNADAHIKSALVGVSTVILIESGRLSLGRWQGIFFCEFDGPRDRHVKLKIFADSQE